MDIGKAIAIFLEIEDSDASFPEKMLAIKKVLEMPTWNGIRKDEIRTAFRWFYRQCTEE